MIENFVASRAVNFNDLHTEQKLVFDRSRQPAGNKLHMYDVFIDHAVS